MKGPATVADLREAARRRLPRFIFDYVDGGSFDVVTLRRNRASLEAVTLRQRVLADVSDMDLSTRLFGQDLAMPLMLAPVGMAGMLSRRGEGKALRAASAHGVPLILSTTSVCPIEEVAAACSTPFWFQLYVAKDRAFCADLLARARAAGCKVLFLTVDLPLPGPRYRDQRSGLSGPAGPAGQWRRWTSILSHPGWTVDVGLLGRPHALGNVAPLMTGKVKLADFLRWSGQNFDPSVSWKDLDFIRQHWDGPLVIKGITDVEDARRAAAEGADGLVVSNHGGRQLDGSMGTAQALPAIADAVGDRMTVLMDGGIRSGLDILRALALGAKGVLAGRPWAYALAAGGEAGDSALLGLLAAEMRTGMALTGCRTIGDVGRDVIVRDVP